MKRGFIAGKWVSSPKSFEVLCPRTGASLARVADLGREEAARAVEGAHEAMQEWKARTAQERAEVLMRWHALQVERAPELARLVSQEGGKPESEAAGEVAYGASYVAWFAEEGKRMYGDVIPATARNKRIHVIRQPVGVAAAITPFNFPNAMILRKAAAALAAGCAFVCKPSESTPLSALLLAELAEEAGLPAGLFSVVPSSDSAAVGAELTSHPLVKKFSFTGSTAVGKLLLKQCASTVKRVTMELGGNAPFIVFEDADLDAAVGGLLQSKFRNYGQTCVCTNRVLVHSAVADEFQAKLLARLGEVVSGPLIDERALKKVSGLVDDAVSCGARVLAGASATSGNEYAPTVLADVPPSARITREEVFGPVVAMRTFESEEEAIAIANDTDVGLAAYFYSTNVDQCFRVSEALEYGMVGVNSGLISTEVAPFGGVKESGMGREGSKYGLDDYTNVKYIGYELHQ